MQCNFNNVYCNDSLYNMYCHVIFIMCTAVSEKNINQGTVYRNAQLRYTQIVYCTLWEECKQTQCPHTEVEGKGLQL